MILPGSDISGLLLFFLLEGLLAPFLDPLIRSIAMLALYVTLADRAAMARYQPERILPGPDAFFSASEMGLLILTML